MPPYSKSEIISGLFVIIAIAIFTLFAFNIIPLSINFGKDPATQFIARFDETETLSEGDKVIFAGKHVGRVTAVEIDRLETETGHLRQVIAVSFEIDDPTLRLNPDEATVSIGKEGILGRNYVDVQPGHVAPDARPIMEFAGDQPIELPTTGIESFGAVFAGVTPVLERLSNLLDRVDNEVLSDQNVEQVSLTLANFEQATAEIREWLNTESPDGAHVQLVTPARELLLRADKSLDDIHKRLTESTLIEAEAFITDARKTSAETREAIASIDQRMAKTWPNVDKAVVQLNETLATLEKQSAEVGENASTLLQLSEGMLVENRPEITEAVRRLRRSMEQAELTLRKVRANPATLIFGDNEDLYEADESDDAWLIRSGRAQPYEQRDE